MNRRSESRGFTLAELLVTLALLLLIASAVPMLAVTIGRLAASQLAVMDTQQRARVIAETLGRDLRLVGAGVERGTMTGPLSRVFTPIWPRRIGRLRADGVEAAREDVITLAYVPDTLLQTSLAGGEAPESGRIVLSPCANGAVPCPIAPGVTLAVFEPQGRVDLFGVVGSSSGFTEVRPLASSSGTFDAGSTVAEVMLRGYWFDSTQQQLRLYDGDGADQPVVDGVTSLGFEYFGTPDPPRWPRPPSGRQNCLYDESGAWRGGMTLPTDDAGLAPLPLAMFRDGPWCGAGATAFDADLLRVRRVRVTVRLRAISAREPLPDYRVVFDIAPRNLALSGTSGGAR